MRIPLAQLRKQPMPYVVNEEMDLTVELNGFEDIISSDIAYVKTTFNEVGLDSYKVSFQIKIDLTLQCAVSLLEVPYSIDTFVEEVFSTTELTEETYLIENQVLDTKEAVLAHVIVQKPMRVTLDGYDFIDDIDDFEDEEVEDKINPAFASLRDLL